MMGEKDLDQARRAPWHHVMLSAWSSSSGWKGVLLLDFKVVWHGKIYIWEETMDPKTFSRGLDPPLKLLGEWPQN